MSKLFKGAVFFRTRCILFCIMLIFWLSFLVGLIAWLPDFAHWRPNFSAWKSWRPENSGLLRTLGLHIHSCGNRRHKSTPFSGASFQRSFSYHMYLEWKFLAQICTTHAHTRNRRRKNGIDFWRRFLDRVYRPIWIWAVGLYPRRSTSGCLSFLIRFTFTCPKCASLRFYNVLFNVQFFRCTSVHKRKKYRRLDD